MAMRRIDAMRGIAARVEAWSEPVVIPTYAAAEPDANPMFLEKRVYQGSSGRVYPLPFTDKVATECADQVYEALHIENEHLYLMVLPQLGGRIHIGYDKDAAYDFFYRQTVIKPALVGLAGPWISGGVEFNWPQHHRPSTYMPCEWFIEEGEDGSRTIWLSEHEPMNRMKGMHGVCLRPDSNLIELKVRLENRTPFTQTFLWWANVAARVHEQYQSFFPPDVHYVADHAKRATATFPHVTEGYYGVPYGERALHGVPEAEKPEQFVPDGSYPPDRLDWYANIPVPTSYMVMHTDFDFFGGYDHRAKAGFVHVADRRISPGKKQWTWGNHEFGYAWDRNLTDEGGPYVELMAGVYTDNQPDFSFLAPYETKSFSQFWYPIRQIGPPVAATGQLAISAQATSDQVHIGICATEKIDSARIEVLDSSGVQFSESIDLQPGSPFATIVSDSNDLKIRVIKNDIVLLEARAHAPNDNSGKAPESATEPPLPVDVSSNDELYLIGIHLEQYRHATRSPEEYWEEALRRDPNDSRCHHAMGRRRMQRGEFSLAESHFRHALKRVLSRNPNPRDGEVLYDLGLCLKYQGRLDAAYEAFAKSAWNYATKGAARVEMARLACRRGDFSEAMELLNGAYEGLADSSTVAHLRVAVLRIQGHVEARTSLAHELLDRDPLCLGVLYELSLTDPHYQKRLISAMRDEAQNYLDLALEYSSLGLIEDAVSLLNQSPESLIHSYFLAFWGQRPSLTPATLTRVFPNRLEEMIVLKGALKKEPTDAVAAHLLGNFLYDRRRYDEAIVAWEMATASDPTNSVTWRNLGIASFNVRHQTEKALEAYDLALKANPDDARILFERDQLWKRTGRSPESRLLEIERWPQLILSRDDLSLEVCELYNSTGQPEKARVILESRVFAPWEGGEGVALGQHARTHRLLAERAVTEGKVELAIELYEHALTAPRNLSEARHLLANASDLWLGLGDALKLVNRSSEADSYWSRAADFRGDFQEMAVKTFSEMTYYRALALRRLNREFEATDLLERLQDYAANLETQPARIDYFATSLPTMLLFGDDLQARQITTARFLAAQAALGLGDLSKAIGLLDDVLKRDPNHAAGIDLTREVNANA